MAIAEVVLQVGPASLNLLKGEEHLRMKRVLGSSCHNP